MIVGEDIFEVPKRARVQGVEAAEEMIRPVITESVWDGKKKCQISGRQNTSINQVSTGKETKRRPGPESPDWFRVSSFHRKYRLLVSLSGGIGPGIFLPRASLRGPSEHGYKRANKLTDKSLCKIRVTTTSQRGRLWGKRRGGEEEEE